MNQGTTNQFKLYIPSEISSDSNLNLSEMRVLATIKALDNEKNCYASNSYLAECVQLSARQVTRVIKSLEDKGYISIENGKSFKRKIKVKEVVKEVVETVQEVKETVKATTRSVAKKVDDVAKKWPKKSLSQYNQKVHIRQSHKENFSQVFQVTLILM